MTDAPQIAAPLRETMKNAFSAPVKIDAEIYHMMDKRDEQLISDEVLHGPSPKIFVYDFNIAGTNVSGISVKGARHLANHYGGLKHRIVSSTEKRGALFTFKSYPAENIPMQVHCSVVNELAADDDFYEVVVEITDIKTGNSVQVSKSEKRFEDRSSAKGGGKYERPNFRTIAESKSRRNAILDLVPQDVQEIFKEKCRKEGTAMTINPIEEKRDAVIKFAAAKGIAFTRDQVNGLDWNQISGLSEAAKEGIEAFQGSAEALGLMAKTIENKTDGKLPPKTEPKKTQKLAEGETVDPTTGEITKKPAVAAAVAKAEPVAAAKPAAPAEETAKPAFIAKQLEQAEQKKPAVAAGGLQFSE